MKRIICIITAVLAAMICLSAVSCNSNTGKGEETTPEVTSESASESNSETETESGEGEVTTSAVAELPEKFNYFSADISEYLSIDKQAYTNMTVSVSSSFLTTDKEIDDYIARALFDARKVANDGAHMTDAPMKKGDVAYIYYRGVIDGKEFEGGSNMDSASPTDLPLGSGKFIPGFEDALIGVIPANTSRDNPYAVNLTFPENYNPAVAGKEVTFYVVVEYAVQYDIPEYNEDSIKNVFKFEAEESKDVKEAHRAHIKTVIDESKKPSYDKAVQSAVWEKLMDASEVKKYPEEDIAFYMAAYKQQFESYYSYYQMMGVKFESFDDFARQYMGLDDGADWQAELEITCREMVQQNLIYHAIAVNEGIEVDEKTYNEEVNSYVEYYKDYSREEIIEKVGEVNIKESALYRLVFEEFVVANCTVNCDAEE